MKTLLVLLYILVAGNLYAQEVPVVQKGNMWVDDIKIDGEINDWGKSLNAYNPDLKSWYSIANNDKYLFLAFKKEEFVNKIFTSNGLQFYINPGQKESINGACMIKFPVTVIDKRPVIREDWKEIEVNNIPGIPDSIISIYNQYGIKIGWKQVGDSPFIFELRVPLELVGVTAPDSFAYNLCLMGTGQRGRPSVFSSTVKLLGPDGKELDMSPGQLQQFIDRDTVTELWGQYRLATKP